MEKKQKKPKKTFALNDPTIKIINELSTRMGINENAVVSVAVHKLSKEVS